MYHARGQHTYIYIPAYKIKALFGTGFTHIYLIWCKTSCEKDDQWNKVQAEGQKSILRKQVVKVSMELNSFTLESKRGSLW
jgi:hypothetical protein